MKPERIQVCQLSTKIKLSRKTITKVIEARTQVSAVNRNEEEKKTYAESKTTPGAGRVFGNRFLSGISYVKGSCRIPRISSLPVWWVKKQELKFTVAWFPPSLVSFLDKFS